MCFGLGIVRSDKLGNLLQMGAFAFVLALRSLVDLLIRMNVRGESSAGGTMGTGFMYMSLSRQPYLLYSHLSCTIPNMFTILPLNGGVAHR
jgi:hypothetical protein